jgi:predicted nucleic acid-binding protein
VKVLVDTSIWSLALRRSGGLSQQEKHIVHELVELIKDARVIMIGPIRQELLSGISSQNQFEDLKERLHTFKDLLLTRHDYEMAAEFYNNCRKCGVQGSQIDFLICAVAHNAGMSIFTSDNDFFHYARYIDIILYQV